MFAGVDSLELYLAQNPDFIEKVNADEATKRAVTAYVGTLYNNYNAFWHDKFSKTDADGVYSSHAYRDFSKGLSRFSGLAKQLGIINQDGFKTSPVDIGKDNIFLPQTSDNVNNYGSVISLDAMAGEYGTSPENITELSAYHGMTQGASQLYSNIDYLTYGEDATTELLDLMTDNDKMQAIALGSALLSSGAKDIMLLTGGASKSTLDEASRILTIAGRGTEEQKYTDEDVGAMRRAYFVITKPDSMYANQLPNHLTGVDGSTYAKNQGYDVKGFREQNSATDESVEMLRELVRLQTQYGATGIVAKTEAFALGVVGQAKQLVEVFGSNDPAYDEFNVDLDPDTNAAMLMETATKVLGLSRVEQLSKMDALKLTLAAKMARAVDPSGRLSNQDFEIQLQRLGSTEWFSDQKGVLTKLNTVLEEFERRQASNQDLLSIINKDNITVEDRRFIKASNAVNTVIAHRRKTQVRAETVAATGELVPKPDKKDESVFDPSTATNLGDGFFFDEKTQTVRDREGNDVTDAYIAAQDNKEQG